MDGAAPTPPDDGSASRGFGGGGWPAPTQTQTQTPAPTTLGRVEDLSYGEWSALIASAEDRLLTQLIAESRHRVIGELAHAERWINLDVTEGQKRHYREQASKMEQALQELSTVRSFESLERWKLNFGLRRE